MIYFDNAATSYLKPPSVVNAVKNSLMYLSANPGRSGHNKAQSAAMLIHKTRRLCADHFGCASSSNVVFTSNCTHALNLAIIGTARRGGNVITSVIEHNSVLRPLFELQQKGIISLTVLQPNDDGVISVESVVNAIVPSTYLVALTHASNVSGAINPVAEIGDAVYRRGRLFLVDAAQTAGHIDIDMTKMRIDMLALAGHKGLHAPQGTGVLMFSDRTEISPIIYGGTGTSSSSPLQPTESPEAYESGTANTPGIAGLNAAIRWTFDNKTESQKIIETVSNIIYTGLKEIEPVTIFSPPKNCGVISILLKDLPSSQVGDILNEQYNIAVRTGLHCAPLIHEHFGTQNQGLVRISVGVNNTAVEAYTLLRAINNIANM